MVRALARGVFQYPLPPRIISYAAVAGKKEGEGPMATSRAVTKVGVSDQVVVSGNAIA